MDVFQETPPFPVIGKSKKVKHRRQPGRQPAEKENRLRLLEAKLTNFVTPGLNWEKLANESEGLSHAEISRACEDAIKESLINHKKKVTLELAERMLSERNKYHSRIFKNSHQQ